MSQSVLGELRRARRKNRLGDVSVLDAIYKAYLTAIFVAIAVAVVSGLVADVPPDRAILSMVVARGPAVVGAIGAFGIFLSLRSASRGGPLSLQAADVRHLLTSALRRRDALLFSALSYLRTAMFWGAVTGAVVGVAAYRRLPGQGFIWIVSVAVTLALMALGSAGAGMIAAGLRPTTQLASVVGLAMVTWSAADVYEGTITSPLSMLGGMAFWALQFRSLAFVGAIAEVVLGVLGILVIGGLSIEAAERRSKIVSVIRFAATSRDIRAIALLRRQLTQERIRSRPWFNLPHMGSARNGALNPDRAHKAAVFRRDLLAAARWPLSRLVRLVILGAIAGLCMAGVWTGTTPLVVVAAAALWWAALDCAEGLGQEVDHPDRSSTFPRTSGWLYAQHLKLPVLLMAGVVTAGIVSASAFGDVRLSIYLGAVTLVPAATAAVAGAAVSILREPPSMSAAAALPELAGAQMLFREILPPSVAGVGLLPILLAHSAAVKGASVLVAAINAAALVMLVPIAVLAWVHSKGRFDAAVTAKASDGSAIPNTAPVSRNAKSLDASSPAKPTPQATNLKAESQRNSVPPERRSRRGGQPGASR